MRLWWICRVLAIGRTKNIPMDVQDIPLFLIQLDFCTVGYFGRNYMQSATHISIRLPECVVIRRSLKRSQTVTASR